MPSVPNHRQTQVLVALFVLGKHFLEALRKLMELLSVAHVQLEDARSHLVVLDVREQRPVQIFVKASRAQNCGLGRGRALQEIFFLGRHLIVDGDRILDVVSTWDKLGVL